VLEQKEAVQRVYLDLTNQEHWIEEFQADPDGKLDSYGISAENRVMLKKILFLFC
jgi:hypothetical protein